MPAPVFIPNPDFPNSDTVRKIIDPIGARVVAAAEAAAPYRLGYLERGIEAEWVEEDGRQVLRITSTDFKGEWYEFGTARQAAQPYLGPAALQEVGNLT